MSHCLNPTCTQPQNPAASDRCKTCGQTLRLHNRYRPLHPIGQGGFGRTFLAIDEAAPSQPRCVIKQFSPPIGTPGDHASARFRQEAAGLQTLGDHPQIPSLIDYLEQDGRQYLVQEYMAGSNLAQELAQHGPFTEPQIRQLLADLLPVMQFIHDRHIIHRDIKPANIIRRRDRADAPEWVLVDLGAAQYATGTALAKTGTVIGSAEFTAPEQARGKAVFASDLYSLGVTCVHLLTEMSPFDLVDNRSAQWVWRDYLPQPIGPDLARVLDRLLASATNDRYSSVAAVQSDLQRQEMDLPQRCEGDRRPRRHHPAHLKRRPQVVPVRRRTPELAYGSQALLMLVPLIFGVVFGVSWLDHSVRSPSSPPSLNRP